MNDSTVLSPSQVYKVSLDQNSSYTIEEIYLNLGGELSGSTVAAFYDNTILIGSVFEVIFLIVTINHIICFCKRKFDQIEYFLS